MVDKVTLPELSAGTTVQDDDLFISRQGADTEDVKVTASQLNTYIGGSYVPYTGATSDLDLGATYKLITHTVQANGSDGLLLEANNGTDVALFGAGGGSNATFYGGVNVAGDFTVDTDVLHVDTTNNVVGIGTASPSTNIPLTVYRTGIGVLTRLESSAADNMGFIEYRGSGSRKAYVGFGAGGPANNYFSIANTAAGGIVFNTNNTDRGVVDTNGNLSIGTLSPSAKAHFVSTTEQLRLGYDASNYYSTTVGSTGLVDFASVGSGNAFRWNGYAGVNSNGDFINSRGDVASGRNFFAGKDAGANVTSAAFNVGIGTGAMSSGSNPTTTVAIGYNALKNSTGDSNFGIGYLAGQSLASGSTNTFLGAAAGLNATSLGGATFIGNGAGSAATTTGSSSVYIGSRAGLTSVGNGGVGIGYAANTGAYGIAIGNSASSPSISIALGWGATATGLGQIVFGAQGYQDYSNMYGANGVVASAPSPFTINATGGSGTNISGAYLALAGGRPTGSGTGGSVKIQTAQAGASGTTLRNLRDVIIIDADGIFKHLYDASNYYTTTVSSAGAVTFDANGSSAGFTFAENVTSNGNIRGASILANSGAAIGMNGRSAWRSSADGELEARNSANSADSNVSAKSVRGNAVTVANLPASPVEGMMVAVTDSTTATWGATITGGGANHVLAYYNGTNWTVAAI